MNEKKIMRNEKKQLPPRFDFRCNVWAGVRHWDPAHKLFEILARSMAIGLHMLVEILESETSQSPKRPKAADWVWKVCEEVDVVRHCLFSIELFQVRQKFVDEPFRKIEFLIRDAATPQHLQRPHKFRCMGLVLVLLQFSNDWDVEVQEKVLVLNCCEKEKITELHWEFFVRTFPLLAVWSCLAWEVVREACLFKSFVDFWQKWDQWKIRSWISWWENQNFSSIFTIPSQTQCMASTAKWWMISTYVTIKTAESPFISVFFERCLLISHSSSSCCRFGGFGWWG